MEVGDRIKGGRWHLDAKLATGGFSVVFSASHRNGSRAAIKFLDSEFTEDEDMRRRFLREGYAANKVGHEGVVRILDDDTTEDGRPYLVMELLDGEALDRRRLRLGGTLALGEVLQIADELLDVLAAAHSHGIVHRDIKPANVFLTIKGCIKVLDFGFAKVKETAAGESTAVGTLLGTPGFLAPEVALGLRTEVDARSDIWSVGATLFMLIAGEHVHLAANPAALLSATAHLPARSLATVASGAPRAVVDIIDRALAFERSDRWASAREMQAALREVMVLEDQTEVGPIKVPPSSLRPAPNARATEIVASLPRLYDEVDEGFGSTKGLTELLPSSKFLQGARSTEGSTQVLLTSGPSSLQAPVAAAVASHPATPIAVSALRVGAATAPRSVLPVVVGAALALLGIALALAALFGGP